LTMVFIEEMVETPPPSPPPPTRQQRYSSSSSSSSPELKVRSRNKKNSSNKTSNSNKASNSTSILNQRRFGSFNWSEEEALACDNFKSPFVLWAQDANHVFLKIDVQDALNPRIKIGEHSVDVLTEATGASGVSIYRSHIDLLHNVAEKESSFMVLSHHIDIKLAKFSKNDWWERLSSEKSKLPWLKIDFDRWQNEDDDDDEERKEEEERERLRQEMMNGGFGDSTYGERVEGYSDKVNAELDFAEEQAKEYLKKSYLFIYNCIMFLGFSYVFWSLAYRMYVRGPKVYEESVDAMGIPVAVLQVLAWAEVIHALTGLVKSNPLHTICQQWGRSFVLFFVILAHPGLAESPQVHWLFFVWSMIEVVRYPFYMLKALDAPANQVMTWTRYSAWIPLYPAGMLLEMAIIHAAIPLFEISRKFSFAPLPNAWNLSFEYGTFLRGYLLLYPLIGPVMFYHMWTQRQKALGVGSRASKNGKTKKMGGKSKRKTA